MCDAPQTNSVIEGVLMLYADVKGPAFGSAGASPASRYNVSRIEIRYAERHIAAAAGHQIFTDVHRQCFRGLMTISSSVLIMASVKFIII
ncbi:hypothetical protein ACGVWS_10455 [Enterobacteriaceae bacterium LUAb1]